jgi:hypothetical protein
MSANDPKRTLASGRCPVLLDRRESLDLQQEVWIGQLRRGDRFTLRRRRPEIARQQINVLVEFGRRRDRGDRKSNVVDCCSSGLEAGANVLAHLLDLRPHIALPDDVAGLVARDLGANYQQTLPVAQCDRICRWGSSTGISNGHRVRKIRDGLPVLVSLLDVLLGLCAPLLQPIAAVYQIKLAVDDSPGLWIHGVFVRRGLDRRTRSGRAKIIRQITEDVRRLLKGLRTEGATAGSVVEFSEANVTFGKKLVVGWLSEEAPPPSQVAELGKNIAAQFVRAGEPISTVLPVEVAARTTFNDARRVAEDIQAALNALPAEKP